jgi:hypothetical protein
MYLNIEGLEQKLVDLLNSNDINGFLLETARTVREIIHHEQVYAKTLYLPVCDALTQKLADHLVRERNWTVDPNLVIHIATEVFEIGGHTRLIEDIVTATPEMRHVLILTDIAYTYQQGKHKLGKLEERFKRLGLEVIFLSRIGLINRVLELIELISKMGPQAIYLFGHHYDTVMYSAINGHSAPNVNFFHHTDNSATIGAGRKDYRHIDISVRCNEVCRSCLGNDPMMLNLTVEDVGRQVKWSARPLVAVTCGGHRKYVGRNGFSYAELLIKLFKSGVSTIHHIGDIPDLFIKPLRAELSAAGIKKDRFVTKGTTESLSESLLRINPSFFLTSHPVGGGRAMVEAMGVGLPFIQPLPPTVPLLLSGDPSFGVGIQLPDLNSVPAALERIRSEGADMAIRSRQTFEREYAPAVFRQRILSTMR